MTKKTSALFGCTSAEVKATIDDRTYIWNNETPEEIMKPVNIYGSNIQLGSFETCIDQLEALKVLPKKEIYFLRKIAELGENVDGHLPSNEIVEAKLNSLVAEWEAEYGKNLT